MDIRSTPQEFKNWFSLGLFVGLWKLGDVSKLRRDLSCSILSCTTLVVGSLRKRLLIVALRECGAFEVVVAFPLGNKGSYWRGKTIGYADEVEGVQFMLWISIGLDFRSCLIFCKQGHWKDFQGPRERLCGQGNVLHEEPLEWRWRICRLIKSGLSLCWLQVNSERIMFVGLQSTSIDVYFLMCYYYYYY